MAGYPEPDIRYIPSLNAWLEEQLSGKYKLSTIICLMCWLRYIGVKVLWILKVNYHLIFDVLLDRQPEEHVIWTHVAS